MKLIHKKIFDYNNESEFIKENVQYTKCIIKGLNLDYETLNKVWFDSCLILNVEINTALLENVRFYNECSLHFLNADNTIFDNVLFDESGILNCSLRESQIVDSAFLDVTLTQDSIRNAENLRLINCNGIECFNTIKSFWNIQITQT